MNIGTESNPFAGTLLTLDQIAATFHVSRTHARDALVKRPDFPKPVPGSTKKKPLWLRDTIEAFLRQDCTQTAH